MCSICTGAHHNHDALGICWPNVIKQVILSANDLGEAVHRSLNDLGSLFIESIDRLARGEENIWILSRATNLGTVRGQRALTMPNDPFIVDHRPHVIMG